MVVFSGDHRSDEEQFKGFCMTVQKEILWRLSFVYMDSAGLCI
jgi:hypothetical protein